MEVSVTVVSQGTCDHVNLGVIPNLGIKHSWNHSLILFCYLRSLLGPLISEEIFVLKAPEIGFCPLVTEVQGQEKVERPRGPLSPLLSMTDPDRSSQ